MLFHWKSESNNHYKPFLYHNPFSFDFAFYFFVKVIHALFLIYFQNSLQKQIENFLATLQQKLKKNLFYFILEKIDQFVFNSLKCALKYWKKFFGSKMIYKWIVHDTINDWFCIIVIAKQNKNHTSSLYDLEFKKATYKLKIDIKANLGLTIPCTSFQFRSFC